MKKVKLKKNKKIKKGNLIIIIITLILITVFITFKAINNYVTPIIMDYANKQAKKVATLVIASAIDEELSEDFDTSKIFMNSSENTIDFNPIVLNKLMAEVSTNVRTYLKNLENGNITDLGLSDNSYFNVDSEKLKNGIIYQVPTGIIFNNGLLSNIGPKIPVKLSMVGDITVDIKTDIRDYGINNAVIQVSINVVVTEQVILPFTYEQITIETDIPIAIKLIEGDIPNYYINGQKDSSLVVPIENSK